MIGPRRSEQAMQSERRRYAAGSEAGEAGPAWVIALPTLACSIVLGGYLLITIVGRLL